MGLVYSGGTYIKSSFSGATRPGIVTGVKNAFVSAGMAAVSNGIDDWDLTTPTTPQGLAAVTFRVYDPGAGNSCARINCDQTPLDHFLLASGTLTYTVIASKYQFFVLVEGNYTSRTFVAGGVPYVESFENITSASWIQSNAISDTDASVRQSFRTVAKADTASVSFPENTTGRSMVNGNGNVLGINGDGLMLMLGAGIDDVGRIWHGGQAMKIGARFDMGIVNETFGRIRFQLWDAAVIMTAHPGDITTTFDSRTWQNVMHDNTTDIGNCSLWVVIP